MITQVMTSLVASVEVPVLASPGKNEEIDADFWWGQMAESDIRYMQEPRNYPSPCPWCGVRLVSHAEACIELRRSWVMKMPFGKYKGRKLDEAPLGYVVALITHNTSLSEDLKKAIAEQIDLRSN